MRIEVPDQDGGTSRQRDDLDRLCGLVHRYGEPVPDLAAILVAIDGSAISRRVVAELLRWHGRGWRFEPHLVNVQDFLAREAAEEHLDRFGRDDTAEARGMLSDAGIAHVLHIAMGPPAERILERAAAIGAEGIVMGTRGRGAVGAALLGSVAYRIVHASGPPVTLVR